MSLPRTVIALLLTRSTGRRSSGIRRIEHGPDGHDVEAPRRDARADPRPARAAGLRVRDDPREIPSPLLGRPAAPFSLSLFDGGRFSLDYGVYGIPELFFVTRDGRIASKHIGLIGRPILEGRIEEALGVVRQKAGRGDEYQSIR